MAIFPSLPRRLALALVALGWVICAQAQGDVTLAKIDGLLANKQFRTAEIETKKAIVAAPQRSDLRLKLARIHLQMGRLSDAEVELDLARERGAAAEEVEPVLGAVWLAEGNQVKLLRDLDPQQAASAELRARLLALRASAQIGLGMLDEAKQSLAEALKSGPGDLPELASAAAQLYVATNQSDKADEALTAILARDPGDLEGLMLRATLSLKRQDVQGALAYYDKALAAHSAAAGPRIGRAVLLYSMGRADEARREVDLLRSALPKNPQVRLLDAQLLADAGQSRQAWDALLPVISDLSHNAAAQILAGRLSLQRDQLAQARDFAATALSLIPDDSQAARLMAAVEQREGTPDKAAALLEAALRQHPADTLIMADLAELYGILGRSEAAAQLFEAAAMRLPKEQTLQFSMALAQIRAGDPTSAIPLLAASASATNPRATGALAAVLLGQGRIAEARQQALDFAARDPKSPMGDTLLGRVELAAGDLVKAKAHFEAALAKARDFVPALQGLASLDKQQGRIDLAISAYQAAAQRNPTNESIQVGLIDAIAASGDAKRAAAAAAAAMEALPTSFGIGIASVELLMRNNDIAQALSVATRLQSNLAQDPEAMAVLAKVQVAAGQPSSAVASLRLMAHKAPGAGDIELAKLLFSLGRRDEARLAIDNGLVKVPAQFVLWQMRLADEKQRRGAKAALALAETARSVSGPLADTLIGDLWMDQGKPDEAAKAYRAALDTGGPANAHLLLQRLMRALVGANRIDDAAQTIRTWLTGHPADLSAAEALGDLMFSAGRLSEAAAAYQDVLARDPNNVNSLNDLALVQARLGQEDPAIETARRAHAIAPGNAAVADTLGWLLVGRGAAQEGLPLLRQAHQGSADPLIAYHLAAACEKTGDRAQALALLAPLAKAPAFSEQAEAMALYRKLGGG